ncbi:MAG: MBL fold metallo-hydrolase [Halobacteria archaeon]
MAVKLGEDLWWLEIKALPFWRINTYLIDDGGTLTLVDSGVPWNTRQLKKQIEATGYKVNEIDRVLLTHYDLDHFGGLIRLDELEPSEVYAGEPDAGYLKGDKKPKILHHKGAFHRAIAPFIPDIEVTSVEEDDEIGGFTVHETPGHNPGHLAYIHEFGNVGFLGDLVWESGGRLTPPIWADSYNMDTLHESIIRLSSRVGEFNWICMGHGNPLENGSSKLERLAADLDT